MSTVSFEGGHRFKRIISITNTTHAIAADEYAEVSCTGGASCSISAGSVSYGQTAWCSEGTVSCGSGVSAVIVVYYG